MSNLHDSPKPKQSGYDEIFPAFFPPATAGWLQSIAVEEDFIVHFRTGIHVQGYFGFQCLPMYRSIV